jgi:hypothetical protein
MNDYGTTLVGANNEPDRKNIMNNVIEKPKPVRFYREPNLTFNQSVFLIIICSAVTGLIVNFFNSVHYSNLVSQADGQTNSIQSDLGKIQYDVKFLISATGNKQINCYDLRSDFARGLCSSHNTSANNSQP